MSFLAASAFLLLWQGSRAVQENAIQNVPLSVPSGAPLRLYLTKRIPKRVGAPVEAKIIEPVFAFDREVLPAGSLVTGRVSQVQPVSKAQRYRSILGGDFTPLRNALLEFDTVTLADASKVQLRTAPVMGLNSIYTESSNKKKPPLQPQHSPKQAVKDQIRHALNTRSGGLIALVHGPNKKERLADFLWGKLPYHPQYLRRGTRFDAPLQAALPLGAESLNIADLTEVGSQPAVDSTVHARLLTPLDSGLAKAGQPVEAVLLAPLFSPNRKLVLPEGTRLIGMVTLAKKARSFHRGGQLRFNFEKLELPPELARLGHQGSGLAFPELKTRAILDGAEGSGPDRIKVDSEGGVQVQESKTRFLAPAISLVLAQKAADNDTGRGSAGASGSTAASGPNANVLGRTLGGGSGFGLAGVALAQSSRFVGMAFGYYGLAWSVYSNVIAKGGEVRFEKNAMMDIRFGGRTPAPATKFRSTGGG
jgi:hypothetical protein